MRESEEEEKTHFVITKR